MSDLKKTAPADAKKKKVDQLQMPFLVLKLSVPGMTIELVKTPLPQDSRPTVIKVLQKVKPKLSIMNMVTMLFQRKNPYHGTAFSYMRCLVSSRSFCGSGLPFASSVSAFPKIRKINLTFILVSYLLS